MVFTFILDYVYFPTDWSVLDGHYGRLQDDLESSNGGEGGSQEHAASVRSHGSSRIGENSMIDMMAHAMRLNGWITWCFFNSFIHIAWIVCLLICQLYQVFSARRKGNAPDPEAV